MANQFYAGARQQLETAYTKALLEAAAKETVDLFLGPIEVMRVDVVDSPGAFSVFVVVRGKHSRGDLENALLQRLCGELEDGFMLGVRVFHDFEDACRQLAAGLAELVPAITAEIAQPPAAGLEDVIRLARSRDRLLDRDR